MIKNKIGDIVDIKKGKKVDLVVDSLNPKAKRYIQIDDLRNDNNLKYTLDDGVEVFEKDIIIAWDGANAGTIGYGLKGIIGSTLAVLKIKDSTISHKLLGRFLQSKLQYLRDNTNGATIPHIRRDILDNLIFTRPISEEKQLRLSSLLDQADTIRLKRRETIRLADEFLRSTFLDMFGDLNSSPYEIVALESIATKITDGVHAKPEYVKTGIPFISVKNITNGFLDFNDCKFISEEAHRDYYRRCNPEYDDILYTKVGATYGRASVVNTQKEFSLYVSVCLIKLDHKKINVKYLKSLMNTHIIKRQADTCIKGIGVPDLHLIEIKNFKIPLPPIDLQNKFAEIVEKTEKLKEKYEQSLQEAENLFNSLMQRAFRGEL